MEDGGRDSVSFPPPVELPAGFRIVCICFSFQSIFHPSNNSSDKTNQAPGNTRELHDLNVNGFIWCPHHLAASREAVSDITSPVTVRQIRAQNSPGRCVWHIKEPQQILRHDFTHETEKKPKTHVRWRVQNVLLVGNGILISVEELSVPKQVFPRGKRTFIKY